MGNFSKIWIIFGFFILFSYNLQALNINSFEVFSNMEETKQDENSIFYGVLEKDSNVYMQLNLSGLEEDPNLEQIYFTSTLFSEVIYPTYCNNISNNYICIANSEIDSLESNVYDIRAIIKDQHGAVITTKDAKICNNYYEVSINFTNLNYDFINKKFSGRINLAKVDKDESCPKVNLSGLELYFDEEKVKTFQASNFVNGIVNFNLDVTNDVNSIKAKAIFMDGYSHEESKLISNIDSNVTIDTTKPQIRNLKLVDEEGKEVSLLSRSPGQVIDLAYTFEIEDPHFKSITFDFSQMVMEQFLKNQIDNKTISADPESCSKNDDTYFCQTLAIPTNEADFTIDYYIEDEYNNYNAGSKSFHLTLDSSGPEVSFYSSRIQLSDDIIGQSRYEETSDNLGLLFSGTNVPSNFQKNNVNNCVLDTSTCYYRNNAFLEYILKINDDNSISQNKTIFDIGNLYSKQVVRPNFFNKTTINSALAGVYFEISSRTDTILKLDYRSTDTAGNSFINNIIMSFVYDDVDPKILNLSYERNGADTYSKKIIATNDKIDLSFKVNETTSSKIYATVDFNEFTLSEDVQTKECTKINTSLFECNFTSRNVKPGPFMSDVYIYTYDLAGNVNKLTQEINITGKKDVQTPEVVFGTPKFTPSKVYRNLASMIGYAIRGTLPLDMESGLLIDRQIIRSCDNDYLEGDLINWYELYSNPGDISSTLSFKLNPLTSTFLENNNYINFSCEIATYIRTQDYIYPRADIQILDFSFELENTTLMTPGEEVIQEIEDDYNKTIVKQSKWLQDALNVLQLAQYGCKAKDALIQANVAISTTNGVLSTLVVTLNAFKYGFAWIPGVYNSLDKAVGFLESTEEGTHSIQNTVNGFVNGLIGDIFKIEEEPKVLQAMCDMITCARCNVEGNSAIDNFWSNIGATDEGYFLGQDIRDSNPTDTFVGSLSCQCIPSLIKKVQDYNALICEKDLCLMTQASAGGSLMECKKTFVEGQCTMIVGEFNTLVPFGKAIDKWADDLFGKMYLPENLFLDLIGGFFCPEDPKESLDDLDKDSLSELGNYVNIETILNKYDSVSFGEKDSFGINDFVKYSLCELPKAIGYGKQAYTEISQNLAQAKSLFEDFKMETLFDFLGFRNDVLNTNLWPSDPCEELRHIIEEDET